MKNIRAAKNSLYFFIGTTAELIKVFPVMSAMKEKKIDFKVISSGQNNLLDNEFLKILKIKPNISLSNFKSKKTIAGLFFWYLQTYSKGKAIFKKEFNKIDKSRSVIIIHGDTISTLMGAKLAKLNKISIAHIESGLRSFNYLHPFPEEISRVLVSKLTDIHFCPNKWSMNNLKKVRGKKINTYQNTLADCMEIAISIDCHSKLLKELSNKKYFVFIMHRQENLLNKKMVADVINKIIKISKNMKCLFILHEPTEAVLKNMGLMNKIQGNKNIIMSPRLPYIEFIKLLKNSQFVITDGGSNQEELFYLGKPCLILRNKTERIEGLGENAILAKNNPRVIDKFVKNYKNYIRKETKTSCSPSKIIVDNLLKFKNKHE